VRRYSSALKRPYRPARLDQVGHRLPWPGKVESKDEIREACRYRADAMAIAFAGRANAAPMNVESYAGESITGDLMMKAW
jgi:hypothetical protein